MSSDSGNGDGGGFFDNWLKLESFSGEGNFFENLGKDLLNYGVQSVTGGFVGVEDGKLSNGVNTNRLKKTGKEVVSGLKEVTGAKAAEKANEFAREQFEETKAAAMMERQQSIYKNQMDSIQKSNAAAATRGRISRDSILGDAEKDYLGI